MTKELNQISNTINQLPSSQEILLALKEAKTKLAAVERSKTEPIAIVGIGCRFPGGANDPESFWQLLRDGVDAVTEIPQERWDIDAYYDPDPNTPGKMYTRSGGFLQHVDRFDPQFFGMSPREAMSLDPQQRLLLEVSWEALENAGQAPNQLAESQTGFFLGIGHNDYAKLILNSYDLAKIDVYACTGNGFCFASGRLSHVLGLQGPNLAIDTACSSSLVAVHLACQSLRTGECNLALAGGVHLILSPEVTVGQCNMRALAPDGRCKSFDASANGFGPGEGCGMIVLKRLSDALADRNNILALMRGSGVNHDGPSSGFTVPNGQAQEALIRQVLRSAKVEPSQVSYVETHGTGTTLGDPIEVRALASVLGEGRTPEHPLMIGSVKTNIGHPDAAAGIAGVIKVVLALQHEEIPPSLHFKVPNPNIAWDELSLVVTTERTPWISQMGERIAGVSSYGMSGTNAHVLIESAPVQVPVKREMERPEHLLTLSAHTEAALNELVGQYENYLANNPTLDLGDMCFTANAGRSHFHHRLSIVASSPAQLREKLAAFTTTQEVQGVLLGQVKSINHPIAFLFTGQGSQYIGMGQQLYQTQPTFRAALERCDEILRPYLKQPLLEVLYPNSTESSLIDETAYTQPALFAVEYALFELWKSWGITPKVVMGHSVGEYVAACVAGVFSLEDALKLIAHRARLMQGLSSEGAMVAVFADEKSVTAATSPYAQKVSIAAINGPENVVISGEQQAIAAVITALEAQGVETKKLHVRGAFHSALMEPMLAAFEEVARQVSYSSPRIGIVSNVTGELAKGASPSGQAAFGGIATPEYWCSHVRQPVRFAAGMETLNQQGIEVFVEIGPKPTLLGMARRCLPESGKIWLPSLRPGGSDWQQLLESLATLYVQGVDIDWSGFDRDYSRRRVVLPTYPFQRQRYWFETAESEDSWEIAETQPKSKGLRDLLHRLNDLAHLPGCHFWQIELGREILPYLGDHRMQGVMVLPGTAYLAIAQAGANEVFGAGSYFLQDIEFHEALFLPEEGTRKVQLIFSPHIKEETSFEIYGQSGGVQQDHNWLLHATGKVCLNY